MRNAFKIILLFVASYNSLFSAEIYKWLDAEGVKQFSNSPPPINCRTASCAQVNKKISKKLRRKKEVELSRIEAEQLMREEMLKKRKRKLVKLSPDTSHDIDNSNKTLLRISTVVCEDLNSIKEFNNVPQARIYLERDNACQKMNEETEYTMIENDGKYSNIRIYLKGGSSQKKWVENSNIITQ